MNSKENTLSKVLLSMQNALLGAVVSSLRAVIVDVDVDQKILFFSFFYYGEITDDYTLREK